MPRIKAYHPEIAVQTVAGEIVLIKPDLDDWYPEGEILSLLAAATGAGTVGEIVSAVERGELGNTEPAVLACRIERVHGPCAQAAVARNWADPI